MEKKITIYVNIYIRPSSTRQLTHWALIHCPVQSFSESKFRNPKRTGKSYKIIMTVKLTRNSVIYGKIRITTFMFHSFFNTEISNIPNSLSKYSWAFFDIYLTSFHISPELSKGGFRIYQALHSSSTCMRKPKAISKKSEISLKEKVRTKTYLFTS